MSRLLFIILALLPFSLAAAPAGIDIVTSSANQDGSQSYSLTIQILILMTVLTLLPGIMIMMTSLARLLIVFHILRQAMGTHSAPPNQVLIGLAVFLTFFIMSPVFTEVYETAWIPYTEEQVTQREAFDLALKPFHEFMLAQTRESDLALFTQLSGRESYETADEVPFTVLLPAFATSEIKTGFQIGFIIFIPFLIVDLVVASILMSMGMMMLSPMIISLPFKIMLFILVDGWALLMGTLASSFYV